MTDAKKLVSDLRKLEKALLPKKNELNVLADGIRRDAVSSPPWSADLEHRHRTYARLMKEVQTIESEIDRLKTSIGPTKQTDIASFLRTTK